MAGFFIVLGDEKITETNEKGEKKTKVVKSAGKILAELCENGYYSTNLIVSETAQKWADTKLKTFADYYSMRKGDYIFFFLDRKIYGVGELINLDALADCKFWAYKNANNPSTRTVSLPLFDEIKLENRCLCFFKPISFFQHAIDMDEALTTYPNSFKSLRVIQGRSFIKMDDEEAQALYAVLEKNNEASQNIPNDWNPPIFNTSRHKLANERIAANPNFYKFTIESLLSNFQQGCGGEIATEAAIEAALVDLLNQRNETVFGKFDYVSHQVSASPAKPVEYMEWIDVFGYKVSQTLQERNIPTLFAINKYYVIEIKKDALKLTQKVKKETKNSVETKGVLHQLMKYIDWVAKNYA